MIEPDSGDREVTSGRPAAAPNGTTRPEVRLLRVGPGRGLAPDSAFGVALTGLWHSVSEAGGSVGFVPPVTRARVAAKVAPVVESLRAGTTHAIAAVGGGGQELIGFGRLRPGPELQAHTGNLGAIMIRPDRAGAGLGSEVLGALIDLARELGLERVDLSIRDGMGLAPFYERFGFTEWGRRTRWIRVAPGDYRDEIFYVLELDG